MEEIKRITKATYRAAGNVVAAASTAPFLEINGAAGKVVRVKRVVLSGLTLTAVAYLRLQALKNSTANSGGTSTAPTAVPLDVRSPAAGATLKQYTAAPTPGALVGSIDEKRVLAQATTAAAAGIPDYNVAFEFGDKDNNEDATLRAAAQNISMAFGAAPATAVTLSWMIEWTEDGN